MGYRQVSDLCFVAWLYCCCFEFVSFLSAHCSATAIVAILLAGTVFFQVCVMKKGKLFVFVVFLVVKFLLTLSLSQFLSVFSSPQRGATFESWRFFICYITATTLLDCVVFKGKLIVLWT